MPAPSGGRGGGPKPKLTPEVHKAIVKAVSAAIPYKFAAASAGVSERSLVYWLAAGREGKDEDCVRLLRDIKKARAEGVAARLKKITTAGNRQWQANAWVLERLFPESFGSDRRELRELKKQIAELMDRVARLSPPE